MANRNPSGWELALTCKASPSSSAPSAVKPMGQTVAELSLWTAVRLYAFAYRDSDGEKRDPRPRCLKAQDCVQAAITALVESSRSSPSSAGQEVREALTALAEYARSSWKGRDWWAEISRWRDEYCKTHSPALSAGETETRT